MTDDSGSKQPPEPNGKQRLCSKCGTEIASTAQVCPSCGYAILGRARLWTITFRIVEFLALISTSGALWFLWSANNQANEGLRLQREQSVKADSVAAEQFVVLREMAALQKELTGLVARRDSIDLSRTREDDRPWILIGNMDVARQGNGLLLTYHFRNTGRSLATDIEFGIMYKLPRDKQILMESKGYKWTLLEPTRGVNHPVSCPYQTEFIARVSAQWTWRSFSDTLRSVSYYMVRCDSAKSSYSAAQIPESRVSEFWVE
jgi:hypothetical protein